MKKACCAPRWNFLMRCSLLLGAVPYHGISQDKIAVNTALDALRTYTEHFVNEENYLDYGFRSYDERLHATLGTPLPITFIRLSDLKAHAAGDSVRHLLQDAQSVWFPVIVDNQVRAKLEMVKRDSTWIPGEFGTAKAAAAFDKATAGLTAKLDDMSIPSPRNRTLVRIPALNAVFLLVESSNVEYLVPAAIGSQRFGLEDGNVYPAQEAMAKLVAYAQKVDPAKIHD